MARITPTSRRTSVLKTRNKTYLKRAIDHGAVENQANRYLMTGVKAICSAVWKRLTSRKRPAKTMNERVLAQPRAREDIRVKRHRNRLLIVNLTAVDPRTTIAARNMTKSPLLTLPPELRNLIFQHATGGLHIHILAKKPTARLITRSIPGPKRFVSTSYHKSMKPPPQKLYNVIYPLEWRQYYATQPLRTMPLRIVPYPAGRNLSHPLRHYPHRPGPRERIIMSTYKHMTLVPVVCRQIYNETKILPYMLNEFSFQDQVTMFDWFANRTASQKRAIRTLWIDLEWQDWSSSVFTIIPYPFMHQTGVTKIRISRLAMKVVYDWYARNTLNGVPGAFFLLENDTIFKRRVLDPFKKEEDTFQIEFVD